MVLNRRAKGSGASARIWLLSSAAVIACMSASVASAQTSPGSAETSGVEEIIVTARRTAENLQDIPLAVSALSEAVLRNNNIVNIQSMNGLVPSLNYQFSGARTGTGRVFFRGLTTGAGGQATRASIFLDGNYLAASAQNVPFNYFQRVEALPGPQSAQFGRATFGGAVNYITKEPTRTLTGTVHADYASMDDRTIDGFVAGPIADIGDGYIAGSLFASYQKFGGPEGWRTPPDILHPNGVQQGAQESSYYAGKLKYVVNEDLTLRVGASYAKFNDAPGTFFIIPPGQLKNASLQRYTNNDLSRPIAGSFLRYPTGSVAFTESFIKSGIGIAQNFYNIQDPNLHDFNRRLNGQVDWNVLGHNVVVNLFHENERSKGTSFPDSDNTNFPGASTLNAVSRVEANSAEVRIASPTDRRFRYTVGAYYLKFENTAQSVSLQNFRCTDPVNGCVPNNFAALFNPTLQNGALVGFTGTAIAVNTRAQNSSAAETTDKSVFGMVSFDVTEKLNATAEVRAQSEELISRNLVSGFRGEVTNKAIVPRFTLQYKFTPDVQAFAVYSVGNNPAGFNPGVASFIGQGATADMLSFKEEKLRNYELGVKSQLLDGRLTANATVYQMDWIDQVSNNTLPSTSGQVFTYQQNRGNSRVRGGEVQVTMVPVENLTINGSLSYNDAKYVDYCSGSAINIIGYVTPGRVNCFVVDGNYLENVPAATYSLSADYKHSLTDAWEGFVGGTFRHRDGQWESDLNLAKSGGQNTVDLRLGAESERVTLTLFCSNCTNDLQPDRLTNLADARLGIGATTSRSVSSSVRRPRQYGIRTTFNF